MLKSSFVNASRDKLFSLDVLATYGCLHLLKVAEMSKLSNLCRLEFMDEDLSMSFPSHSVLCSRHNYEQYRISQLI